MHREEQNWRWSWKERKKEWEGEGAWRRMEWREGPCLERLCAMTPRRQSRRKRWPEPPCTAVETSMRRRSVAESETRGVKLVVEAWPWLSLAVVRFYRSGFFGGVFYSSIFTNFYVIYLQKDLITMSRYNKLSIYIFFYQKVFYSFSSNTTYEEKK